MPRAITRNSPSLNGDVNYTKDEKLQNVWISRPQVSLVGSEQYIRPDVSICIVRKSLSQYVG